MSSPSSSIRGQRSEMKKALVEMIENGFYNPNNSIHRMLPYEVSEVIKKPPCVLHVRMLAISKMPSTAPIEKYNEIVYNILKDVINVAGGLIREVCDEKKNSLLHCAIYSRNNPAINLLLQAGLKIGKINGEKLSALDLALINGNTEAFQTFLRKGASVIRYAYDFFEPAKQQAKDAFIQQDQMFTIANDTYEKLKEAVELGIMRLCTRSKLRRSKHLNLILTKEFSSDSFVDIPMSSDYEAHEETCAIQYIIVIFPMKWINEMNSFVVRNGPIMLDRRPTIKSSKFERDFPLEDLAVHDPSYGVPAGMFFHVKAEKEVHLQFTTSKQQREEFEFIAVHLIKYTRGGNHVCKTCKKKPSQN